MFLNEGLDLCLDKKEAVTDFHFRPIFGYINPYSCVYGRAMNSCVEEICEFFCMSHLLRRSYTTEASELINTFSLFCPHFEPGLVKSVKKCIKLQTEHAAGVQTIKASPPTCMLRCFQQIICQCQCSMYYFFQ